MARSSKGIRRRTRSVLRKSPRDRGLPPLSKSFADYKVGDKASVVIEPSVHGGQPHTRFQGETGTIAGKQGKAYVLKIKSGNKEKELIISPEHLKRQEG